MGVDIPESTLVGWCGRAMKTLLPLIESIEGDIMGSGLLHTLSRACKHALPGIGRYADPGAGLGQGAIRVLEKA